MALDRKIKYGMVGGGPGAFIGEVHRKAAAMDGEMELAAGAFSSSADKSRQMGKQLFLNPDRVYGSYQEMDEKESKLPEGERIDFVSVVTPNNMHFPVARTFIEAGFNVVCDKPMTTTLEDAEELCRLVKKNDVVFTLTHNYTGYPMVKQAKALVEKGVVGDIRKIVVEYPQGWLATRIEQEGNKQAEWRTDPKRAGVSSCMGDIGTHAENLARYITGLEMQEICADLTTFLPGRKLEDDGNLLIHYQGGARGVLHTSQISIGEENNLKIRVYGSQAALEWHQEEPNYLYVRYGDKPEQVYKRGNEYLEPEAQEFNRIPPGHPEAFIEAFANIYLCAARTIRAKITGEKTRDIDLDFPTVQDGAIGVNFIHRAIESGKKRGWVSAEYTTPA
ncbi:MAG: Gfo/Idh/MocA family protein [Spirochaetota bacterium]